ncbi:flagellar biosynthesis protein FlhF [Steroidobacter denitrificans]|uniref:Flagellar biosynthesis protein FlhF n=1 Tax=Steroidobacter denitrificans TaxID=465721 RepID=A0A127F859_STEDE|nr:flagellar biosynthesis protein FlhF [Steroidobacter denitrificans]AMN46612.1 flagellar biosynthesis protein FlhF [Steroidobacter denitrificans]
MKIKQYRAADMRQALRLVKEAQGPDAVILSSRRIAGGVEIVAAVDYDCEAPQAPVQAASQAWEARSDARAEVRAGACANPREADVQALHRGAPAAADVMDEFRDDSRDDFRDDFRAEIAAGEGAGVDVNEELRNLRRMLETQLATLAWNDLSRRAPIQTELLKQLSVLGIAHDLAGELVSQLPSRLELAEAYRLALALMARRIEVVPERWVESGGIVAMVGATGVGKTTLLAKLAARWVMRHGPRELALVTTDSVRIGAQEQLHTLGRLLGVPAYAIDGPAELPELLDHLGSKRLVLIDTAGLSQRDPRLGNELDLLARAGDRLETALVISAAAQAGAIEEAVAQFAAARPVSCTLTKLDEAASLGGALSMLMRSGLPLAYLSDGQRVPEDLHPARAHRLIARAVELSRSAGASADEDLLSRRFGAVAHALA